MRRIRAPARPAPGPLARVVVGVVEVIHPPALPPLLQRGEQVPGLIRGPCPPAGSAMRPAVRPRRPRVAELGGDAGLADPPRQSPVRSRGRGRLPPGQVRARRGRGLRRPGCAGSQGPRAGLGVPAVPAARPTGHRARRRAGRGVRARHGPVLRGAGPSRCRPVRLNAEARSRCATRPEPSPGRRPGRPDPRGKGRGRAGQGGCPVPPAGPRDLVSPSRTMTLCGISTMAVVPPYGDSRSETLIPCRAASWPTTNRPSWSLLARSNSGGLARRALISASSPGARPSPRSSISTAKPFPTASARISTRVVGGEKRWRSRPAQRRGGSRRSPRPRPPRPATRWPR